MLWRLLDWHTDSLTHNILSLSWDQIRNHSQCCWIGNKGQAILKQIREILKNQRFFWKHLSKNMVSQFLQHLLDDSLHGFPLSVAAFLVTITPGRKKDDRKNKTKLFGLFTSFLENTVTARVWILHSFYIYSGLRYFSGNDSWKWQMADEELTIHLLAWLCCRKVSKGSEDWRRICMIDQQIYKLAAINHAQMFGSPVTKTEKDSKRLSKYLWHGWWGKKWSASTAANHCNFIALPFGQRLIFCTRCSSHRERIVFELYHPVENNGHLLIISWKNHPVLKKWWKSLSLDMMFLKCPKI